MAKRGNPVKQVTLVYGGKSFTITVYQAAVGYVGEWEGEGESGSAGFMPTIEDVVAMAKLRIQEHFQQKRRDEP